MSIIRCPWCGKEITAEEWSNHLDSHIDPAYDKKLIRESHKKHYPAPKEIDPEMIKFVTCLARRLTKLPSPGEYASGPQGVIARLLETRMEYEEEIYKVLMGNKTLDEFSSYATKPWNIDRRKLSKMIYECLVDLRGKEVEKVRKNWHDVLRL